MTWRVSVQARIGTLDLDVDLQGTDAPTVLLGSNGSGKTTLLRIIAGSCTPRQGVIRLSGCTLLDTTRHIDLPSEQRGIGYVPQGYGLFPHLRVLDNVAFGLGSARRRQSRTARRRAAMALLDTLHCAHLAARMPAELSGGEQQRVALARALIIEPQMLLLDEPLAAMDVAARRTLRAFLAAHLVERGKPAVVVTHDVRDVLALDAQVCVLDGGRIVQRGSVAELRRRPATELVAELLAPELPVASAWRSNACG